MRGHHVMLWKWLGCYWLLLSVLVEVYTFYWALFSRITLHVNISDSVFNRHIHAVFRVTLYFYHILITQHFLLQISEALRSQQQRCHQSTAGELKQLYRWQYWSVTSLLLILLYTSLSRSSLGMSAQNRTQILIVFQTTPASIAFSVMLCAKGHVALVRPFAIPAPKKLGVLVASRNVILRSLVVSNDSLPPSTLTTLRSESLWEVGQSSLSHYLIRRKNM